MLCIETFYDLIPPVQFDIPARQRWIAQSAKRLCTDFDWIMGEYGNVRMVSFASSELGTNKFY